MQGKFFKKFPSPRKMGANVSNLTDHLPNVGAFHCAMIGLDSSGKTTVLYRLKYNQYMNTAPTIGFNCEKVRLKSQILAKYFKYFRTRGAQTPRSEGGGPREACGAQHNSCVRKFDVNFLAVVLIFSYPIILFPVSN